MLIYTLAVRSTTNIQYVIKRGSKLYVLNSLIFGLHLEYITPVQKLIH
jgi:hypothetical protein